MKVVSERSVSLEVIAPDLPGFGFTEVPEDRGYVYTFDALAKTMLAFTDAPGLEPGNMDIQLHLVLDYANDVKLYPAFQQYFRQSQPKLLAIWGKNDLLFIPAGAEAFRRDLPVAELTLLDTGHFALETHVQEVAAAVRAFLA